MGIQMIRGRNSRVLMPTVSAKIAVVQLAEDSVEVTPDSASVRAADLQLEGVNVLDTTGIHRLDNPVRLFCILPRDL